MPELRRDVRAMRLGILTAALFVLAAQHSAATITDTAVYQIDPAKSRVTIHVGKSGLFSFAAGHTHEVAGPIQTGSVDVDPDTPSRSHVQLVIASSELQVSAAGEPAGDAPKVQETMQGETVLDVRRYPKITYESAAVSLRERRGSVLELNVTGRFTIRDVSQSVTLPVHVELTDSGLSASGRFEIKQSAFGIKPVSVAGVVSVRDTLAIDFSIVATKDNVR
jgi:polyisoprenoid-binding protein YceI